MSRALRVLIIEDREPDALLLLRELKQAGFQVSHERVETPEATARALDGQPWDLIISDYQLPRFDANQALALVKERKLDVPFIIVSGAVSEDMAIEAIRAGAHDFLAKGHFARLIPAIERELRDVKLRQERTQMQEHLYISDRMASLGALAAGVAHEINNPMAVLMSSVEYVTNRLVSIQETCRAQDPDGDLTRRLQDLDEPLQDAAEAAERVRLIVKDLKIFSRAEDQQVEVVEVNKVMESALRMASTEHRRRPIFTKEFGEGLGVMGSESRLGQVFLNFIVNAMQSFPEGRGNNQIKLVTRAHGADKVAAEVRDNGVGMSEATLRRLFVPFFTTKPPGVGTGLGLAICKKIVEEMGGTIEVESQPGVGTTFRVVLPRVAVSATSARPPSGPKVQYQRGNILVIDDEPTTIAAIWRALSTLHTVSTCSRAKDALVRLSQGEQYDVILSDMVMPEMGGMEFFEELGRVAPGQAKRVVFMTGDAFTIPVQHFLASVGQRRIEKPFKAQDLRDVVQAQINATFAELSKG